MKRKTTLAEAQFGEADFLALINSVPVSYSELELAVNKIEDIPKELRKGKEAVWELGLLLDGDWKKAMAILCRLLALLNLIESGPVPYVMVSNTERDRAIVDRDVLLTATTARLRAKNGELEFDRESFLASLVKGLEPEGTG